MYTLHTSLGDKKVEEEENQGKSMDNFPNRERGGNLVHDNNI